MKFNVGSARKLAAAILRRLGILAILTGDTIEHAGLRVAWGIFWKQGVMQGVSGAARRLRTTFAQHESDAPKQISHPPSTSRIRSGVLFVGYAQGALGLGQAFRSDIKAAAAADLPFAIYPIEKNIEGRLIGPFMPERYDRDNAYAVNIIEVAADQIPAVLDILGPHRTDSSYNILKTYWELPRAPEVWRNHLSRMDEIWVPNQFVADAFAPIYERAIHIVPPAVEHLAERTVARETLGLGTGRYYFLFSFDYNSSPFRKNPIGVLDAFHTAFPKGDEPVGLVIKTNGRSDLYPQIRLHIDAAAKRDPRIQVINDHLDRDGMLDLLSAADAYVSLHKAEGFGLGMAEAMMLRRSVVGTNFSGSTDFLNSETGHPIPYRLQPIQPHEYPGSDGQFWADPDVEVAATAMRHLVDNDQNEVNRRQLAAETIRRKYSYDVVGQHMKSRIESLCLI